MAKLGNYKIPFDLSGNQLHYGSPLANGLLRTLWRENVPFDDVLSLTGHERGRSAAYFTLTRQGGQKVTMFMKEMVAAIPHFNDGKLAGTFQFIKRGENYGIILQAAKHSKLEELREALEVYADPSFYHACSFEFDRPTGGFDEDFSMTDEYDYPKPGKHAREVLGIEGNL